MKTNALLKFSNDKSSDFALELRKKVKEYFQEKGISKNANTTMVIKTIFMLALYIVPYGIMISGITTHLVVVTLLWILMGLGAAGIGLAIMHDANHKAYSKNQNVNRFFGHMLNFIGGDVGTWEIQHNVKHHGYTNIEGFDEDIDAGPFLRLSPYDKLSPMHRYQHIYAWFLYCLMSLQWVLAKDFRQIYQYRREGMLPGTRFEFIKRIGIMILSKLGYYGYILILPLILLPFSWWIVVILFLIMQFVTGFLLTIIFQTAHVMPTSNYVIPDDKNTIADSWMVHEMSTTTNYAKNSKIFSWFIGGLNYQIEHHLFPNICHVHYPAISGIVNKTAKKYGIQYNSEPTFLKALISHGKMLKQLGRMQLSFAV